MDLRWTIGSIKLEEEKIMATRSRPGQGTIRPRQTKTKGTVYDAWCSPVDPRTGRSHRVNENAFPTRAAAQAWINKTMSAGKAATGLTRQKTLTVPHIVEEWLREDSFDKAGSTMQNYMSNYKRHFPTKLNVRVDKLDEARVRQFVREVGAASTRGDGRADARTAFNNLRRAMKWARQTGRIDHNPMEGIRFEYRTKEKHREAIPLDDAKAIIAASVGKVSNLVWRMYIETGARRGEILGLDVRDLDFRSPTEAFFNINKIATPESHGRKVSARTKTGAERGLPLTAALSADLYAYTRGKSPKAPLFASPTTRSGSGRLAFDTIGRWWHRDLKAAGLEGRGYVPHMLRHTFATELLGDGEAPNVVSALLGHSTPATTMRFYAHTSAAQKIAAIGRVGRLMSTSNAEKNAEISTDGQSEGSD
jgi:integrase